MHHTYVLLGQGKGHWRKRLAGYGTPVSQNKLERH